MQDEIFMKKAIELSKLAVEHGNEPFGAVLVKDDQIIFTNENQIYMNVLSIPAVNPVLCAVVPWYG